MAELLQAGFSNEAATRILALAKPDAALELRACGYDPDYVVVILCGAGR